MLMSLRVELAIDIAATPARIRAGLIEGLKRHCEEMNSTP
jgi:hypothetical protein